MGGGTKYGKDAPKARSIDLMGEVASIGAAGEAGGGGLRGASEFCARRHTVVVVWESGRDLPQPGTTVRLAAGENGLRALAGLHHLGRVSGPTAEALLGCLRLGFELTGSLEAVDFEARTGQVTVVGRRTQAP